MWNMTGQVWEIQVHVRSVQDCLHKITLTWREFSGRILFWPDVDFEVGKMDPPYWGNQWETTVNYIFLENWSFFLMFFYATHFLRVKNKIMKIHQHSRCDAPVSKCTRNFCVDKNNEWNENFYRWIFLLEMLVSIMAKLHSFNFSNAALLLLLLLVFFFINYFRNKLTNYARYLIKTRQVIS